MNKSEVLSYYGGVTATARYLNIAKSSVSGWSDPIPWKYALLIAAATAGSVPFNWEDYPELFPVFKPQPEGLDRG